jgi:lysine 6-dehydrogenase
MAKKIVLLGYGRMGRVVLDDLLKTADFEQLLVADAAPDFASRFAAVRDSRVRPAPLNVDDRRALLQLLDGADIVIELLPVRCTMQVAQAAVEAGAHMVSSVFIIDWSVQDAEGVKQQQEQLAEVDRKAREKGLTVLKEFGMDPGLDLIIAGHAIRRLDEVKVLYTYGAGFPEHRLSQSNPLGYKFTWSVVDTMHSYRIPGRIVVDGEARDVPADGMFEPANYHLLDLEELGGPLECFVNGDGITLTQLFPQIAASANSMGRFICRWPGHAAFWDKMVKCGFNRNEPVRVNGVDVIPAEFCAALLASQRQFQYGDGERDVAFIRADARGFNDGKPVRALSQLIDYRDLTSGYTAMQRTVGFTMSIGAQMILNGGISRRGVVEPTQVPYEPFVAELRKRQLKITTETEPWNGETAP